MAMLFTKMTRIITVGSKSGLRIGVFCIHGALFWFLYSSFTFGVLFTINPFDLISELPHFHRSFRSACPSSLTQFGTRDYPSCSRPGKTRLPKFHPLLLILWISHTQARHRTMFRSISASVVPGLKIGNEFDTSPDSTLCFCLPSSIGERPFSTRITAVMHFRPGASLSIVSNLPSDFKRIPYEMDGGVVRHLWIFGGLVYVAQKQFASHARYRRAASVRAPSTFRATWTVRCAARSRWILPFLRWLAGAPEAIIRIPGSNVERKFQKPHGSCTSLRIEPSQRSAIQRGGNLKLVWRRRTILGVAQFAEHARIFRLELLIEFIVQELVVGKALGETVRPYHGHEAETYHDLTIDRNAYLRILLFCAQASMQSFVKLGRYYTMQDPKEDGEFERNGVSLKKPKLLSMSMLILPGYLITTVALLSSPCPPDPKTITKMMRARKPRATKYPRRNGAQSLIPVNRGPTMVSIKRGNGVEQATPSAKFYTAIYQNENYDSDSEDALCVKLCEMWAMVDVAVDVFISAHAYHMIQLCRDTTGPIREHLVKNLWQMQTPSAIESTQTHISDASSLRLPFNGIGCRKELMQEPSQESTIDVIASYYWIIEELRSDLITTISPHICDIISTRALVRSSLKSDGAKNMFTKLSVRQGKLWHLPLMAPLLAPLFFYSFYEEINRGAQYDTNAVGSDLVNQARIMERFCSTLAGIQGLMPWKIRTNIPVYHLTISRKIARLPLLAYALEQHQARHPSLNERKHTCEGCPQKFQYQKESARHVEAKDPDKRRTTAHIRLSHTKCYAPPLESDLRRYLESKHGTRKHNFFDQHVQKHYPEQEVEIPVERYSSGTNRIRYDLRSRLTVEESPAAPTSNACSKYDWALFEAIDWISSCGSLPL
ncbi:uncharacterized protein BDR25DRAFT_354081 [Lindgomyces ingoldianus]|uniref:Uncharacterized protein n=1 Tax=Lindgomyces ingoldianus TaxID=673940 RepID=A0ACB6QZ54_9PLEO|nr:uncharacterized protein BDR25DRAFT_354081 [Lindgomyces ingoldianus]KAF2471552.1 hypothetical protein BDR25DRAFT_354081 [Lindgomyces ingoldianus]